jgi:dTDP-4-amino-4,6-dideoxygalactose transaminase
MDEIREFEMEFEKYTGAKHAIACSSGTAALHAAVIAMGLKEGTKVITTPFTFIASANCILYQRGIPVFADIEEESMLINPDRVEELAKDPQVFGMIPVHLFGKTCDMARLKKIAYHNDLWIIEDCAQAFGARIGNQHVGTFGDIGCFSFYATKNLWTFEGGMITTDSDFRADLLRMIINHGSKERYVHEILGYNFRMSRISALIGCTQLKLHAQGAVSELGSYGIKNGHYPYVVYDQPLYKRLGIYNYCPIAEAKALEARSYFKQ